MCSEVISIAGRYNKYLRNLSQSPWFDKDDVRVKNSVQELIEDGLKKYLKYDKSVFSSCGREDVDVRMLGRGRPFVFKLHNPQNASDYDDKTLRKIEDFVNQEHANKIKIRDLQIVSKSSVAKHLNEGQESKAKEYRALCCSSRKLTSEDIEKINRITELTIEQKTPIRVLHRRTLATRSRKIHRLRIASVNIDEFDSITPDNLDNVFTLTLLTEAGTYIKEFVHGDFGRTEPNLSSIIGDCETDLIELDVMEVYVDWPPSLDSTHSNDKMENTEESLSENYNNALKLMREAGNMPRGDERQDKYIRSRQLFERTMEIAEKLSLFSDNETIEDITTKDLKYLLVPAFLAHILLSSECTSNSLDTFKRAEELIVRFLTRISHYGLADERIERLISSNDSSPYQQAPGSSSLDAAMRARTEKIEKFKKMKLLESKLEELERVVNSGQDVDDETAREYYMNLVNKWIEDSSENLERQVRPAIIFETSRGTTKPQTESKVEQKPKVGETITIVKDQMQKQVFGLGYPSRPTVTVDEFITKKIKDGDLAFQSQKEIYSNSLQRYAEQPRLRQEQEEKSDEERESKEDRDDPDELARKRRWDEFKDENPRGSGNRHNMG